MKTKVTCKESAFLPEGKYRELRMEWYTQYIIPDSGIRCLWACCIPVPISEEAEKKVWEAAPKVAKGSGYVHVHVVGGTIIPRRKVSPEGRSSIRQKRMEARIRKKDPLFADQFIEKKLKSNAEYFCPEAIAKADILHEKRMLLLYKKKFVKFVKESVVKESWADVDIDSIDDDISACFV